jgi:hypothetical protein
MLAAGMTQVAAAEALGVTDRTIRKLGEGEGIPERPCPWTERGATRRPADAPRSSNRKPPADPSFAASRVSDPKSDERDARLPLSRADLHSQSDRVAASAVAAGRGIQAIIEAAGPRTRDNVLRLIDPEIFAQVKL